MATKTYAQAIEEWTQGLANSGHICVDLDGTLAHYDNWAGELHIGPPIPTMVKKVQKALAAGLKVKIFTARMADEERNKMLEAFEAGFRGSPMPEPYGPIQLAIRAWTKEHIGVELPATAIKDYQTLEIWDDRARQVVPNKGRFVEAPKKRKAK